MPMKGNKVKRALLLISVLLAISLLALVSRDYRTSSVGFSGSRIKTIYFISDFLKGDLSTDIADSELLQNAYLTYNSIGKLVRFENENQTPYLAKSWNRNGKSWTFNLNKDLVCEDGEAITPSSFKVSLERTFKSQAQNGEVPVFKHLKGFEKFLDGEALVGLEANDSENTLTFIFNREITSGVLEYLAMSPFGYICRSNFDKKGLWKDKNKIISSGSYKLTFNKETKNYELNKRNDWPLIDPMSPDQVILTSNEQDVKNWKFVVAQEYLVPEKFKDEMYTVQGIPFGLSSFSLLSTGTGFFSKLEARRIFHSKFREVQKENEYLNTSAEIASEFYPSQPYGVDKLLSERMSSPSLKPKTPLLIKMHTPNDEDIKKYAYKLLVETMDRLGWSYEIDTAPLIKFSEFKDPKYDMRYIYAEIGMGVQAWGNEMLFCSELGPEFPDPDGEICKLTEQYNRGEFSYEEFAKRFSETVAKQSAVIPILSTRYVWHLGKNIDKESFSPLTNIPPFDLIRFK